MSTVQKVRRLKEVPDGDSAVGQLACALRRTRAALGLTQAQAGDAIEMSTSTVQRAEAGDVAPRKCVVDGYVTKLGLDSEEAERLYREATRPPGRQRRPLTQAPSPPMVSTPDELGRALARAWEEDNRPSMQTMEDRVAAVRDADESQKRYPFLSRSAAYRISHRQQLPSSVDQLQSYLYACRVKERRFPVWIKAYHRVKEREKEEATAKKAAAREERSRWRKWGSSSSATLIMLRAGLQPSEPFPRSDTAPWTAQCVSCGLISRFRLSAVRQGHACPRCATPPS
ncbi:helix-turn-helix transcriptional regulator [Streptomyces sp. AN-3]|uniref:Helix-turn-helix domain-containing protein n=1 Tax=Streptomyces rochei TaxID=1928 RepID=A0ABW7EBH3_STRRO|nr:helix-turn-helix transcriptional regulator [Streptomyces sp. AN-3]MDI3101836.1 helix-turn-helix transcriptional regulator [Streptomyces sp. AN-3]